MTELEKYYMNLWTAKETAKYLGVSYGTFRNKLADNKASGQIPPYHWVMKRRRWLPTEVEAFVKNSQSSPEN